MLLSSAAAPCSQRGGCVGGGLSNALEALTHGCEHCCQTVVAAAAAAAECMVAAADLTTL